MLQERLNDAAIALCRILDREEMNFGIFGGYAVAAMGGVRESKDIDCLASTSKSEIIELLDGKEGFVAIPQTRNDYVAFLWSDQPGNKHAVLVEIFCEQFPGSEFSMAGVPCHPVAIRGLTQGQGTSRFLDPFYLFKGKLRAATTRAKFHDSANLRLLANKYESSIKPRAGELSLEYVGLALKRYVELGILFERLGVDIEAAKATVMDMEQVPGPGEGDVQRGLLA